MTQAELLQLAVPVLTLVAISSVARTVHHLLFQRYFKLTFANAPVWSLFYFGAWTTLAVLLFEDALLFGAISFAGYLALILALLVLFPLIYRVLRERVGSPQWLATLFPGQGMLSLEERYIVAKVGDVVFQQCVAGALILTLAAQGVAYPAIVAVFIVLFALAHLYIFRTAGFFWGLHYTMYAALAGFAFPFLVLFVTGGIGYAIVLHMLFYVLSAAFFAKLPHPKNAAVCHDCLGHTPSTEVS